MKLLRLFIIAILIPSVAFSSEKTEEQVPQEEMQTQPQATQEATKKSQNVTVNAAGFTFIAVAVGGILIAALQSGGSIAH